MFAKAAFTTHYSFENYKNIPVYLLKASVLENSPGVFILNDSISPSTGAIRLNFWHNSGKREEADIITSNPLKNNPNV